MKKNQNLHTISVYVTNHVGVLGRICLIFSRRGFNIESLVVSPTKDEQYSRMTITSKGDKDTLKQIIKQVTRLIDVLHAIDHTDGNVIEIESALVKILILDAPSRTFVLQLVSHFKAQTVDFTEESLVIHVSGKTEKLDAFISMLSRFDVVEIVRTGKILMCRGKERT